MNDRPGNGDSGNPPSQDPPTNQLGFGKILDLFPRKPEVVHIDPAEIGDPLKLCGSTIADRFLLQMCIGKGGMACVYLAYDIHADRDCVVKVALHPCMTPRFEREAQCYWLLEQTPGVPQIYDHGTLDDGKYYLALQLVRGETLAERLENGARLPWPEATALGIKLNRILSAVHRAGVLHRDIKPGNVMLTPDGDVYIIDFGMAWFNGARPITQPNMPLGTEGYQSPEQRMGLIFELDQQTDIYSVAMTLRFAIGGPVAIPDAKQYSSPIPLRLPDGTPFIDKSLQAVLMQRRVRALIPFIPPALADVLQKASAPTATDRYPTDDEFSDALRPFLTATPIAPVAAPIAANEPRAAANSRRWWRRVAFVGLSAVASVAVIGLLLLMRPAPHDAAGRSTPRVKPAHWIESRR